MLNTLYSIRIRTIIFPVNFRKSVPFSHTFKLLTWYMDKFNATCYNILDISWQTNILLQVSREIHEGSTIYSGVILYEHHIKIAVHHCKPLSQKCVISCKSNYYIMVLFKQFYWLSCCHLTFRKIWYCLIKTRIDSLSRSLSIALCMTS